MKTIFALSASLALLTSAGYASASDELVNVTANAPAICALPNTWTVNSTTSGANAGQFSGTTWTIPESQFATSSAMAFQGGEIAIRLRGQGICNTSHTIQVASARGGLTAGDATVAPPSGFTNRRAISTPFSRIDAAAGPPSDQWRTGGRPATISDSRSPGAVARPVAGQALSSEVAGCRVFPKLDTGLYGLALASAHNLNGAGVAVGGRPGRDHLCQRKEGCRKSAAVLGGPSC